MEIDVYQSYYNAYQLIVGDTTYIDLAKQGEFYLPEDHEDADGILRYFRNIEEYMKCHRIAKVLER